MNNGEYKYRICSIYLEHLYMLFYENLVEHSRIAIYRTFFFCRKGYT